MYINSLSRVLTLVAGLLTIVVGKTGQGFIFTEKNDPIPYCLIIHSSTGNWHITDVYGHFIYSINLSTNDTLIISRYGYHSKRIPTPQTTPLLVQLKSNPVKMKPVHISTNPPSSNISPVIAYRTKTPQEGEVDHRKFLSTIPGLSIRSYGGPASVVNLSLDGGTSSQTKVIVGGFDLTNTQNGSVDISQLPTSFIENIQYFPKNGSNNSSSGDGIIYLNPWTGRNRIQFTGGSYKHQSWNASLHSQVFRWRMDLLIGQRHDGGNYPVVWRHRSYHRSNNYFSQDFGAFELKRLLSKQMFFRVLGLKSNQKRGVAGLVWNPSTANRNDRIHLIGSTLGWIHDIGVGSLDIVIQNSYDNYYDEQMGLNNQHYLRSTTVGIKQLFYVLPVVDIGFLLRYKNDKIESKPAGFHSRQGLEVGISTKWKPNSFLLIQPEIRQTYFRELFVEENTEIHVVAKPNSGIFSTIGITLGQYFRPPTFNELYWEPGGNVNLLPEHTRALSLNTELVVPFFGTLQLYAFDKESNDLIQWVPQNLWWSPQNIKRTSRFGLKAIWNWENPSHHIYSYVSYGNIHTVYENPDDHYGKPLIYSPEHTVATILQWVPTPWSFQWQMNITSYMISKYSWPEDIRLPPVFLNALTSSYTSQLLFGEIITTFSVNNLLDTKYELVQGYPELGRTWRLTFTYTQLK